MAVDERQLVGWVRGGGPGALSQPAPGVEGMSDTCLVSHLLFSLWAGMGWRRVEGWRGGEERVGRG